MTYRGNLNGLTPQKVTRNRASSPFAHSSSGQKREISVPVPRPVQVETTPSNKDFNDSINDRMSEYTRKDWKTLA